jgi:hypothetical protein
MMQEQLKIGSTPTMNKYLEIWESHRMIHRGKDGYKLAQLDGSSSGISAVPIVRQFRNAKSIINYWGDLYEEHYGMIYPISNWGIAAKQIGKLLDYSDGEIEGTLRAIIRLYDTTWSSPKYPRPTLGAVCSWLFVQAQPYAVKSPDVMPEVTGASVSCPSLLDELEAKGWL